MSKDRSSSLPPRSKKGKGKRVVAVSPAPARPAPLPGQPVTNKSAAPKAQPTAPRLAPPPHPESRIPAAAASAWSISLEAGLYILIGLIAFLVRLYALDRFPLQESEGVRAWAAWALYRGLPDVPWTGHSPLPIFGAMLSFIVFGPSDAAARLLPALAGGVTALLPFALRRELGRGAALLAAAMLALSPTLLYSSRSVDGGIIVAGAALALVACALAYAREERDVYVYAGAVALAVMFAADRTAGPTAVILGTYAALAWRRSDVARELPVQALRNGAAVFLAVTVVLGSGLLSNLQGVQGALVDPLGLWVSGATTGNLAERVLFYARVILSYEMLALAFASIGLASVLGRFIGDVRKARLAAAESDGEDESADDGVDEDSERPASSHTLDAFLVYWCLAATAFYVLLGDQSAGSAAQVVLPLTLLAATAIARLIAAGLAAPSRRTIVILAIVVAFIVLAFVPWFNPASLFGGRFTSLERRIQSLQAVILAGVILLMAALAGWYAYRLRLRLALLACALALGVSLAVFTVHSAWQLNHVQWPNATEPLLPQRTGLDMRLLLNDVRAVSRKQGDDAVTVTLDDRVGQPVRWYLRQFSNLSVTRSGAAAKSVVTVVPADAKDATAKSLGRDYVSQRYRLRAEWAPGAPLARWLRWAHVRDPITSVKTQDIIVFFKLPQ